MASGKGVVSATSALLFFFANDTRPDQTENLQNPPSYFAAGYFIFLIK